MNRRPGTSPFALSIVLLSLGVGLCAGVGTEHTLPARAGHFAGKFLLDSSFAFAPAPMEQIDPAIAGGVTQSLIVWSDDRWPGGVYAARLSSQGELLDPAGIQLGGPAYSEGGAAAVAFCPNVYLAVWQAIDSTGSSFNIYGARVNRDGQVYDSIPIEVCATAGDQLNPSVAHGAGGWTVVWQDERNGPSEADIYGARVGGDGRVLDPEGYSISRAPGAQCGPAITSNGTGSIVAWQDLRNGGYPDVYATRLNDGGGVLDTAGIPVCLASRGQYDVGVGRFNSDWFITWEDRRNGNDRDIFGARVSRDGRVLDTAGIPVCRAAGDQYGPQVALRHDTVLVVWQDFRTGNYSDVFGARLTPDGRVLDASGIAVCRNPAFQGWPAVAASDSDFTTVWYDERLGTADIFAARVTTRAQVRDTAGIIISTVAATQPQTTPAAAFGNGVYLVAWSENRSGDYPQVCALRVAASGRILDSLPLLLSRNPSREITPSVAFDGTNFLVVWCDEREDEGDVYGVRVSLAGVLLDSGGIAIAAAPDAQLRPGAAWDGECYLVAWYDYRGGEADIFGARVTAAGVVLDPSGIPIAAANMEQYAPAVCAGDSGWLAAWHSRRLTQDGIWGARVNRSGRVLDSANFRISVGPGLGRYPALAFDGTTWLVLWEDGRNQPTSGIDVYAARVTFDGIPLDSSGTLVCGRPLDQTLPAVVADGTGYTAVWENDLEDPWDIAGARLSSLGNPLREFTLAQGDSTQLTPALVHGDGEQILALWSGWIETLSGRPLDTRRIWGKFSPFTGIAETPPLPDARTRLAAEPNPFRDRVRVTLPFTAAGTRELGIFDISGRCVRTLHPTSADRSVTWDGTDAAGTRLPTGVYLLQLRFAGRLIASARLTISR